LIIKEGRVLLFKEKDNIIKLIFLIYYQV